MNKKTKKEQAQILHMLVEGNSLRATERMIREAQPSGCSINTIQKLLLEVGEACAWYQDKHLRNLKCERVQMDEIWSFVYSKQKNTPDELKGSNGDCWTWTGMCADAKLMVSWRVGGRDADTAQDFVQDIASRMANRIQLTSDAFTKYKDAVESAFGADVDYGQLVKVYGKSSESEKRYSPTNFVATKQKKISGNPDKKHISTSFVERQNLTMRMSMRRFTRLTNGFSKKLDNHVAAISLHFMYYNFCRIHKSLKASPAMAANVSETLWNLEDIVTMSEQYHYDKKRGKI